MTPIASMRVAAILLSSKGKKKPKRYFVKRTTAPIKALKITINSNLFNVCLNGNEIARLITHKFKATAAPVARAVARMDPFRSEERRVGKESRYRGRT